MSRQAGMWLFMTLMVVSFAAAQEEEEPLPPPRRASAPKIGGGAGFIQNWLQLDLDPINQILKKSNAAEFSTNGLLMLGGQGYGYIMLVNNLRIGGMGASGTRTSHAVDPGTRDRRDVELSAGYGGVTVDYVIPVAPRLDLTVGGLIGGGGMSLIMTLDKGDLKIWDELWQNFGQSGASAAEYSKKLSGSFFVYQPAVNVEYALLRWLGVRAGVSYMGLAGSSWRVDDRFDLAGTPDNISSKGWMFNGGLFVGTFIF